LKTKGKKKFKKTEKKNDTEVKNHVEISYFIYQEKEKGNLNNRNEKQKEGEKIILDIIIFNIYYFFGLLVKLGFINNYNSTLHSEVYDF